MPAYLQPYLTLVMALGLGCGFITAGLTANRILRPHHPTPGKLASYESGVDAVGSGWEHITIRYYLYAFLYLLFAVEAAFIFPWAPVIHLPQFTVSTAIEMGIFAVILSLGLAYAWRTGALNWHKSQQRIKDNS